MITERLYSNNNYLIRKLFFIRRLGMHSCQPYSKHPHSNKQKWWYHDTYL